MLRRMLSFVSMFALGIGCAGGIGSSDGTDPSGTAPGGKPDSSGDPSKPRPQADPSTGNGGAGGTAAATSVDPKLCGAASPRIWKLTPDQYSRTVQSVLGASAGRAGDDLVPTLAGKKLGFSNDATGLEMSEPHVSQLLLTARRLAGAAVADAKIFPCTADKISDQVCLRAFVDGFGAKAFRRPLPTAEVDSYLNFFQKQMVANDGPTAARLMVTAIFMSPSFVFRTELGPDGLGATGKPMTPTLTAFEKASALSYFITDGPPDPELWNAAKGGQLETREQLVLHARRLLSTPTGAAGLLKFVAEQFDTQEVKNAKKDAKVFPDWKPELQADMAKESDLFVQQVLWKEDGKLSTLLSANFSMLSPRLAGLYGMPTAPGVDFQKMMLPGTRAGLLTQPGMMSYLARETDTDPVKRGKYLRETVLCQSLPPPPANVNAVPPPAMGRTQRERMVQHSADATCVGCHGLMDPLGLAFENYDGIGKYRTVDVGKTIDATGKLNGARPESAPFANGVELMGLLARSPDAAQCFIRKTFEYAQGRSAADRDACSLAALAQRFDGTGGTVIDLVAGIVSDDSFLVRKAVAP